MRLGRGKSGKMMDLRAYIVALVLIAVCWCCSTAGGIRGTRALPLRLNLLTHNMLQGYDENSYPLKIEASKVAVESVEFNPGIVISLASRIDYDVLKNAVESLGPSSLPDELPAILDPKNDEKLLKNLHRVLLEVRIEEGWLVCPKTNKKYKIARGIPNMLKNDAKPDEHQTDAYTLAREASAILKAGRAGDTSL